MIITKQILEHELEGLRLQLRDAEAQVNLILGAIQATEQLIVMADNPEEVQNESQIPV
jgi:hypothetical protein